MLQEDKGSGAMGNFYEKMDTAQKNADKDINAEEEAQDTLKEKLVVAESNDIANQAASAKSEALSNEQRLSAIRADMKAQKARSAKLKEEIKQQEAKSIKKAKADKAAAGVKTSEGLLQVLSHSLY